MLASAVANYALRAQTGLKYLVLLMIYGLALYLFRREIATLWRTFVQLVREGAGALRRRNH